MKTVKCKGNAHIYALKFMKNGFEILASMRFNTKNEGLKACTGMGANLARFGYDSVELVTLKIGQ